jgi:hypothetical protein
MVMLSISLAYLTNSSGFLAILTPPALPLPPTRTWAFRTTGYLALPAARSASSGVLRRTWPGTFMPALEKSSFPSYSYSLMLRGAQAMEFLRASPASVI